MFAVDWFWTINLMLDLIGYNLELCSWVCLIWLPFGIPIIARSSGAPFHLAAILFVLSVLVGLTFCWFSKGIYKRRRGRMLVLASLFLAFWGWAPLSGVFSPLAGSKLVGLIGASPPGAILYAGAGVTLLIGLAQRKALEVGGK